MQSLAPNGQQCKAHDEEEGISLIGALMCSIMLLNSVIERVGNRVTEAQGLTLPQWLALGCAAHGGEDGVSHSDIGRHLMLSKAPITGVVDRLERAELVERRADSRDRRVSRVVATPKGIENWKVVKASLQEHVHGRIGRQLSESDQERLLLLLGQMLEVFSEEDGSMAEFTLVGETEQ